MSVTVQIVSKIPGIPPASALRTWAEAALTHQGARKGSSAIVVRVVNRAEGQRLNQGFRGKSGATNVLTFAYSQRPLEADIVLCAQIVAAQARAQNKLLSWHYAHLTVHGVLHACGFDHEKRVDAQRMESLEIAILGKLGIANPYET